MSYVILLVSVHTLELPLLQALQTTLNYGMHFPRVPFGGRGGEGGAGRGGRGGRFLLLFLAFFFLSFPFLFFSFLSAPDSDILLDVSGCSWWLGLGFGHTPFSSEHLWPV